MNKIIKIIFVLALFLPLVSHAQCKHFTKKHCISQLDDYKFNGQLNAAILTRGDTAELVLSFYSNQKYRLFVCNEEQLGDVTFKLLDADRNVVYESKKGEEQIFDFQVPSTQKLILQVFVHGEKTTHSLEFQGCVSVLIGFIEPEDN